MTRTYTKEQLHAIVKMAKVELLVDTATQLEKCESMVQVKEQIMSMLIACKAVMETDSIEEAKIRGREITRDLK